MIFRDFLGNELAKEQISGQIDKDRLHNTIIIEGPKGSGKKTFASIIAMAAVCEGEGEKPCLKCSHCIKAAAGNHPDILWFAPNDKRIRINRDETEYIRERAFIVPNEARRNVIVLEATDEMELIPQNMLLKVLEDTPKYTNFILLCKDSERLLSTVRSRGTILRLGGVDIDDAVSAALKQCPKADKDQALAAAEISGGVIGETVDLISNSKLKQNISIAADIAKSTLQSNSATLLSNLLPLEKDRNQFKTVLEIVSVIFKDAALISAGADKKPLDEASIKLADRFIPELLIKLYDCTCDILKRLNSNGNLKLLQAEYMILLRNRGEIA